MKVMRYEKCQPGRILFKYNYYSEAEYRRKPTEILSCLLQKKEKQPHEKLVASNSIPAEYHKIGTSHSLSIRQRKKRPITTLSESNLKL